MDRVSKRCIGTAIQGWMVFLLVVFGAVCLFSHRAWSAPANGECFNLPQPDGSTVEVKIWGDEFCKVIESRDGYTLIRDPNTGYLCYARLSSDHGDLTSTGVQAGKRSGKFVVEPHIRVPANTVKEKRHFTYTRLGAEKIQSLKTADAMTYAADSSSRSVQGICLIIDFPDDPGTVPPSGIDAFCNQIGYTGNGYNGSVRDYFEDVSDGRLIYTNFVPDSYYRAVHNKLYYDAGTARVQELILEALNHLESSGFDFSQYDSDNDGYIDAINCLYAGSGYSEALWPHCGSLGGGFFTADNVSAQKYQVTWIGSSPPIGVFCHENGHLLCGWPDLYDTGNDSRGVGEFCLMGYGGTGGNHAEPCAYLKYISGWSDTMLLTAPVEGLAVTAGVNSIYKYEHPLRTNEYFLIENRQQTGWDSTLPDAGIAIWHIDTEGWNDNQQMTPSSHYEVTLVQADGLWDLENNVNSGDTNDLWKAPAFTVCGPYLFPDTPGTNWWDGAASNFSILDISPADMTMTFTCGLDSLQVTPETGYSFTGPNGGPFIPQVAVCTLTNTGNDTIEYLVNKTETWFDINGPISGMLVSGGTVDISVTLNENAEMLPDGLYISMIRFSNNTSGIVHGRSVVLAVYNPVVVIDETDFSEGLPDEWSIIDGYGDGKTWNANNPCGQVSEHWAGPFMIVDKSCSGGANMDEQLITKSFDCSRYESVTLNFSHYFTTSASAADVDIRVNKGSWQNIVRYTAKSFGKKQLLLPDAARQNDVQIRWRYVARNEDYWWGIDNVQISGSCAVVSMGDFNFDCQVDLKDMVVLAAHWLDGNCDYHNGWCYGADLDRSSSVNFHDFADFARYWSAD